MRTLTVLPNSVTFYTDKESDIPADSPEDNITILIKKRNADMDRFLGDTITNICNNAQDYRLECGAVELHIEDGGHFKFIHALDEMGNVENIQPFPEKAMQMLNVFSENCAALQSNLLSYEDWLNSLIIDAEA